MDNIRIGIVGYGNLGKSVEKMIKQNPDMELVAIFTRRNLQNAISINEIFEWKEKIDVMILCGSSLNDLPKQSPMIVKNFNTVDGFDTHSKILEYFKMIDKIALQNQKTAIISAGWDPGLFSINRIYSEIFLPNGFTNTFWGPGISQGHSTAIRKIEGVEDAVEYTIPKENAINQAKRELKELSIKERILRKCYVVAKENADKVRISERIRSMPDYFFGYETEVYFIDEEEMKKHKKMPHGGIVVRRGKTSENEYALIENKLKLDSNPDFTANILLAYSRAVYRLYKQKVYGAKTVIDIPAYMLSSDDRNKLIEKL